MGNPDSMKMIFGEAREALAVGAKFKALAIQCGLLAMFAVVMWKAQGRASASGPYIDPAYLTTTPFGSHSHWLQPWRAYLETVPARNFVDGIGVGLDLPPESVNLDVILQMLCRPNPTQPSRRLPVTAAFLSKMGCPSGYSAEWQ
jgi:hypothetical protein